MFRPRATRRHPATRLPTTARRAVLVTSAVAAATVLFGAQTAFAGDDSFVVYSHDEYSCGSVVGLKVCLFDADNVLSGCQEGENTVWDG